jgi:hypothetical protein
MQQRRPHSNTDTTNTLANDSSGSGGGNASSREERRLERRLAKERRLLLASAAGNVDGGAVRKLQRVKRNKSKYQKDSHGNSHLLLRLGLISFGLFSFVGFTAFRLVFRHGKEGEDDAHTTTFHGHAVHGKFQSKAIEYNSDNIGGNLLSKLRGTINKKYIIPEAMERIGNKAKWYAELRREYDTHILPKDDERSFRFVEEERKRQGMYQQSPEARTDYDIHNCPEHPPEGYPIHWPVLDVLHNWSPDNATPHHSIFQGLCNFDYRTELSKAENYRRAELPFVMRNDPSVTRAAERWNHPGYLERLLMGEEDIHRRTEYSPNNHFMFWVDRRSNRERQRARKSLQEQREHGEDVHAGFGRGDQEALVAAKRAQEKFNELKEKFKMAQKHAREYDDDEDNEAKEEVERLEKLMQEAREDVHEKAMENWQPPTEMLRMTYLEWLEHANVTDDQLGPDNPHWYFRLIGCGNMDKNGDSGSCDKGSSEWLYDELPFFQPRTGEDRPFYIVEPKHQMGIHCRFGMKGVIAENHFDLSRNAITLLAGQRRYILAHPNQCLNMNLLPRGHPSARHSAVDWSDPDLENYPTFKQAKVNEIVMQPGDVLYLPTNWFHYIISLELNMQCNTRSGGERLYRDEIEECGFGQVGQ